MPKRKPANVVIPYLTLELASRVSSSTYLFNEKAEGFSTREEYIDSVLTWARSYLRKVEAFSSKPNN